MSAADAGLVVSVFLASAVEAVEALTIVLAAGIARGWRGALSGAGAAVLILAALIGLLGPALAAIPLNPVRIVIGLVALLLGARWLRKAVLRAAGLKARHDEQAIYAAQLEQARRHGAAAAGAGVDRYAFRAAFLGCFMEGLEVVVIVLSFGSSQHHTGLAAAAAGAAVIVVAFGGLVVHRPLARVPENAMKLTVAVLLVSFGLFWTGEGAGLGWPGGEASLLVIVLVLAALALGTGQVLRRLPAPG